MLMQFCLAQVDSGKPQIDNGQVIMWGGALIIVVILGFSGIAYIKRKLRGGGEASGPNSGFSLSELRAMRDRGEITSEEYEQTRARVIEKVKGKFREEQKQREAEELGEVLDEADPDESGKERPPGAPPS